MFLRSIASGLLVLCGATYGEGFEAIGIDVQSSAMPVAQDSTSSLPAMPVAQGADPALAVMPVAQASSEMPIAGSEDLTQQMPISGGMPMFGDSSSMPMADLSQAIASGMPLA